MAFPQWLPSWGSAECYTNSLLWAWRPRPSQAPLSFLSTGFLCHFGRRQVEEADPEGQRNTAVFQKTSCGGKPGHFLEEVTFKLSWWKQVDGQGHGMLVDLAGGGVQLSLNSRNFVLRARESVGLSPRA